MAPVYTISPISSHSCLLLFLTLIDAVNDIHIVCARRMLNHNGISYSCIHPCIHLYLFKIWVLFRSI